MTRYCFLLLFIFAVFTVEAQNYLKKNEYFHTLVNGLKVILIEDTTAQNISVQLSINAGTSYEAKPVAGGSAFIAAHAHRFFKNYNTECILTNDYTGYYSTTTSIGELNSLFTAYLSALTVDINTEPENLNANYINYNTSFTSCTANKGCESAVKIIYTNNENRLGEPLHDFSTDTAYIANVAKFKNSFYCPQNAFLIVNGNFKKAEVYKIVQNVFLDWKDCTYSPFRTFPVQTIKTNDYNVQLKTNDESATANLNVYYPGPVVYKNKREVLAGLLFAKIMNDENSGIRSYFADSFNIKNIRCDFNLRRFISLFSLKYEVDSNSLYFVANYNFLGFLNNASLYNADLKTNKFQLIENIITAKDVKQYINTLTLFNATISLDYFGKIRDSINSVTLKDIIVFAEKHILKNDFVAVLNNQQLIGEIDSVFTETAVVPDSYEFYFKRNTATFSDEKSDSVLNSLYQWLLINPSSKIKINGVAGNDELLTIKDDEMLSFYKNNPAFVIAPSDLIPTKKMRLDVYRSMTIVRKLVEKGISLNQISGTGKLAAANAEAPEKNYKVYCTIRTL